MQPIIAIFNGVEFSHHLAESAIAKAKDAKIDLHALFLAGHEKEEGYPFPNDLDEAQDMTDKQDAEKDDMRVIRSQMKLMNDMARAEGINCSTELIIDPSLEDVLDKINAASLVLVDASTEDGGVDAVTSFKMKALIHQSQAPVEEIR